MCKSHSVEYNVRERYKKIYEQVFKEIFETYLMNTYGLHMSYTDMSRRLVINRTKKKS